MKRLNALLSLVVFASLFLILIMREASAYLDPGTGSYCFQLLIGFMVGAVFAMKVYWQKITGFLGNLFSKKTDDSLGDE